MNDLSRDSLISEKRSECGILKFGWRPRVEAFLARETAISFPGIPLSAEIQNMFSTFLNAIKPTFFNIINKVIFIRK